MAQSTLVSRTRGVYYGWWLSVLAGVVMVVTSVPIFHSMTVWAPVLERQFGWSRAQLGLALTFTRVEGGLMGPVEGYLVDRFGTRKMLVAGLVVLAGAFVLFSGVQNLWMFYLAFIIMSMGAGLGGWVPQMTMLNHWFVRRRGTAMGVSMMVMGVGALLVVPAIAWAIDPDHQRIGWRATALIVAGVAFVSAVVLPMFIRNRPQDVGLLPDGDESEDLLQEANEATAHSASVAATMPANGDVELTVGQALRTQGFWCIAFGHGFASMIILAIMTHLGLMMEDLGYGIQTTAWIVMVYTAVSIVFQFAGGYLGDRIPKNLALFVFTTLQGVAVVILTFAGGLSGFYAFAVLFGIGFGGRTPLTTAIRGEYFGRASFGRILGVSTVPMNVLLLIAAPMAGYMHDRLGDYDAAFITLAGLNFLGAFLFLIAKKPRMPEFGKEVLPAHA